MPSDRVSTKDFRDAMTLVGECRELGADPAAWHPHLLSELSRITRAQVAIGANLRGFSRGRAPTGISVFRLGWPTPSAERLWNEYVTTVPVQRTPEYARLVGFSGPLVTRTRQQLYEDSIWYRYQTFNDYHRACGIDHYVFSILRARLPNPADEVFNSVWVHRALGEPAFGRREWWIVHAVHAEIGRLVGNALTPPGRPAPSGLTSRQRQTLARLLHGDSEKQIAALLGLSPATVHEYVVAVYRHFGVQSRGELLARFIDPRIRTLD
ncbi:MAG: helix-turn-helix transcriptional regulator [Phycisphaerae bacterium]|nr:helix-turn-helix transcriptional regulator [Phycisphaerae bacterium]